MQLEDIDQNFVLSNEGKLNISEDVLKSMIIYIQDQRHKREAGGVLIGRFIKNSKHIIVDEISVPMAGDVRSRTFFKREVKKHQEIIDKAWERSNGTLNYLGEWHTHPENYPSPSHIDLASWKLKLTNDIFSSRYLYFIIVGIKEIGVWEGDRRKLMIKKLYNG